jgi:hypothetical protein
MIQGIRTYFARRLLRQLIELATEALYSEQFDMGSIVNRLCRNRSGVPLLRAFVAIQTAAQLGEPLNDTDVDRAFDAFDAAEKRAESPVFRNILDVHKELAEHYWSLRQIAILRGKLAHKNDRYSYEGTVYFLQHTNKGPVSTAQRAKCVPICKQMADLNRQIEAAELEAWKKQDEQEYHRYKEELEVRALSAEIDANEDHTMQLESAEVISMLKAKLNAFLNDGGQKA